MPEGLFTWQTLGTLTGAAAMTYLIVAYTKALVDPFWKAGTDLYAVLVSAVVLLCAAFATGEQVTWTLVVLAVFNSFIVAAAAGKINDKALTEANKKKGTDAEK